MSELQKYQWTMSGMRPDDSQLGAMWFYRGFDTDLELMRLGDELQSKIDSIEKLLPLAKAIGKLNAELLLKDEELLRVAKDMDEQCRINVALRAELAQTCNCRFEDGEQTMWCPLHLRESK